MLRSQKLYRFRKFIKHKSKWIGMKGKFYQDFSPKEHKSLFSSISESVLYITRDGKISTLAAEEFPVNLIHICCILGEQGVFKGSQRFPKNTLWQIYLALGKGSSLIPLMSVRLREESSCTSKHSFSRIFFM